MVNTMLRKFHRAPLVTGFITAIAALSTPAVAQQNLQDHGGGWVAAPEVYLVFWEGKDPGPYVFCKGRASALTASYLTADPNCLFHDLETFASDLGGSPNLAVLSQYGTPPQPNLIRGVWWDTKNGLEDDPRMWRTSNEAFRASKHFGTYGNPNAIYVIITGNASDQTGCSPDGVSGDGFSGDCPGYHFDRFYCSNGVVWPSPACGADLYPINYIFMPYNSGNYNQITSTLQHEIAEAITDRSSNGWYEPNAYSCAVLGLFCGVQQGEIGDQCSGQRLEWVGHDSLSNVQSLWSNSAGNGTGKCVFRKMIHATTAVIGENGHVHRRFVRDDGGGFDRSDRAGLVDTYWADIGEPPDSGILGGTSLVSWGKSSQGKARSDLFVVSGGGQVWDAVSEDTEVPSATWVNWGGVPDPSNVFAEFVSVAAVSTKPQTIDAYAVAWNEGAYQLYTRRLDMDYWALWQHRSALPPGSDGFKGITASFARMGGQDLTQLFVVDQSGQLWVTNNGMDPAWSVWTVVPGISNLVGRPAVASWGDDRQDIVVIDSSGVLWHGWYDASGGTPQGYWEVWPTSGIVLNTGPGFVNPGPAITALGDNNLLISAFAEDGRLYEFHYHDGVSDPPLWVGSGISVSVSSSSL